MKDIRSYHSYQNQMEIKNPFVLVIGPAGSGKKYQSRKVAEDKGRQYVEIEGKKENIEGVVSLVDLSIPTTVCIYDYSEMSKQAINAMLKIAEETPNNLNIVLCSRTNDILPTIRSRAHLVYMDNLSRKDIEGFVEYFTEEKISQPVVEKTSRMCRTVGEVARLVEIEKTSGKKREEVIELFDKILDNIDQVSVSNSLKLVDSLINDKEKYNFIPYLGRYGMSVFSEKEFPSVPLYKLEFWLQGTAINDSYEAHRWIINYKEMLSIYK